MDYFQTLLDQALVNYVAFLMFTQKTQEGVESIFEPLRQNYLQAENRMTEFAQRVEYGVEGRNNAAKTVGSIATRFVGAPDSKENYQTLQR